MPGKVFHANLKIFAKTLVLHTNLQVFILLIKMFSRALLAIFHNARTFPLSSKLPEYFCVRAVDSVAYTRNRVLTSTINDDKNTLRKFF